MKSLKRVSSLRFEKIQFHIWFSFVWLETDKKVDSEYSRFQTARSRDSIALDREMLARHDSKGFQQGEQDSKLIANIRSCTLIRLLCKLLSSSPN